MTVEIWGGVGVVLGGDGDGDLEMGTPGGGGDE